MQRNGGSSRLDMDTLLPPSADGGRFAFNVAGNQLDGQIAFLGVRGRTHSRVRMRPTASTTDKHKFTQIKVNSQSVFICVHLWLKRSFPISVNGYALACWRPTLVALDFARRFNRDSHAARTLSPCIECGSRMNWHVNSVSNVARRGAMIPDRISAASERCTCHVARTVVT